MADDTKSLEYDDDGYKKIFCKNPKCRRYLTKVNTAGECSMEIPCPHCGTITLYRIAQEKIAPKGSLNPGASQKGK